METALYVSDQAQHADDTIGQQQGDKDFIVVGCALLPKKIQRYLTDRMLRTAAQHRILLKTIDYTQPLGPQGPFNVIIHKLRPDLEWELQLRQYVADHPSVVVVDRLDKIRQLHNRATMLRPLQGDGILLVEPQPPAAAAACTTQYHRHQQQPSDRQAVLVQAPLQVEIAEGTTEAEAQAALAAAGLAPPLLCKPLWTDGRDGSHKLAVLHDLEALGRLLRGGVCSEFKPPLVVQQFVEHGGVLFKVYVLGSQTYVTARPSLGETVLDSDHAVQQLPRISCVSVFSKQHQKSLQQPATSVHAASARAGAAAAAGAETAPGMAAAAAPVAPAPPHHSPADETEGAVMKQPEAAVLSQQQQQQPSAALAAVSAESVWQPPCSIIAPPVWLTSALAATLRQELGMQLFNFDLIVPEQQQSMPRAMQQQQHELDPAAAPALCYVVDINFFPGVDKIPDFEQRFVNFLLSAATTGCADADTADGVQVQHTAQRSSASEGLRHSTAAAEEAAAEQQVVTRFHHSPCAGVTAAAAAGRAGDTTTSRQQPGGAPPGQDLADEHAAPHTVECTSPSLSRSSSGINDSTIRGMSQRCSNSSDGASGARHPRQSWSAGHSKPAASRSSVHHSRRHSGAGDGGSSSSSRQGGVLEVGAALSNAALWCDGGVLGSSPPQLQVAGCS